MAQKEFDDIQNVAIVDIDGHHGNGTQDIFYNDPSVLYISAHEWGIFPGTGHYSELGSGEAEGKTVNLSFIGGTGDRTYGESFRSIVFPIIKEFKPDLMVVSIGSDGHLLDPLTTLSLSSNGYLDMTRSLIELGRKELGGKFCFELEGGYHTYALAETFCRTMAITSNQKIDLPVRFTKTRDTQGDKGRIKEIKDTLASFWSI
jgi:acetoin utilization deacetylase AcuC-like enzyme